MIKQYKRLKRLFRRLLCKSIGHKIEVIETTIKPPGPGITWFFEKIDVESCCRCGWFRTLFDTAR